MYSAKGHNVNLTNIAESSCHIFLEINKCDLICNIINIFHRNSYCTHGGIKGLRIRCKNLHF